MDKGPWTVEHIPPKENQIFGRVYIESADFKHDVWLYVTGDFSSLEQKLDYAEFIAAKLNS